MCFPKRAAMLCFSCISCGEKTWQACLNHLLIPNSSNTVLRTKFLKAKHIDCDKFLYLLSKHFLSFPLKTSLVERFSTVQTIMPNSIAKSFGMTSIIHLTIGCNPLCQKSNCTTIPNTVLSVSCPRYSQEGRMSL